MREFHFAFSTPNPASKIRFLLLQLFLVAHGPIFILASSVPTTVFFGQIFAFCVQVVSWNLGTFAWEKILVGEQLCPPCLEWMPTRPNWLRSLKPLFILSSMHVGFILRSCLSG